MSDRTINESTYREVLAELLDARKDLEAAAHVGYAPGKWHEREEAIRAAQERLRAAEAKGRAALATLQGLSPAQATPEVTAEQYIAQMIDRGPEPLRRLADWLSRVLDEDEWKTAERMLLGAYESAAHPPAAAPAGLQQQIMNLPCPVPPVPDRDQLPDSAEALWAQGYKYGHRDARHAAASLVGGTPPGFPLPDGLFDSKDWKDADYAGRVEWLFTMYESCKAERDELLEQSSLVGGAPIRMLTPPTPRCTCLTNQLGPDFCEVHAA